MKRFNITVNGKSYDVAVEEVGGNAPIATPVAASVAAPAVAPASVSAAAISGTKVNSPMPGVILNVKATVGQAVKKGEVLMILEAMKMENDIVAPVDGKVSAITVKKGDNVNSGDALASIE